MKPKTPVSILVLLVVLAAGFVFTQKNDSQPLSQEVLVVRPQDSLDRVTGKLGGETFDVMVARTEDEQKRGLGGLSGLAPQEAMLFPYKVSDFHGFWMKDMNFSIDIVWLDQDSRIVHIEKSIAPDTYPKIYFPASPSRSVVEFSAGTIDRLGVSVGNFFEIGDTLSN